MRGGPALGFIALIAVAIGIAAFSSRVHPGGDLPPSEQPDPSTQNKPAPPPPAKPGDPNRAKAFDAVKTGAIRATLEIADRGTIVMEFYPQAAPKTVAHITDLIKKKFYDGIKIHRVEPGFVVQMGDPVTKNLSPDQFQASGAGSHGSGSTVPLEAKLPHLPYSVGLARSQSEDSGDSQFYFSLKDNASLDGRYCVFGMVTQGQDVVDKLQIGDVIKSFTLTP
jgi:cyclophilin family peptidyl-prolyl cis-trans isomerase